MNTNEFSGDSSPRGFSEALKLFKQAATRVPAYRDFLALNNINHEQINTYEEFCSLPPVNKENYLRHYPLQDLMWDGDFSNARIISTSSGSSGQPFYWFRGNKAYEDSVTLHEKILNNSFNTKELNTLFVVAFAMGTWVGGTYTLFALNELANRGHRVVTITPGINKDEIVSILKNISPNFEQTIIAGYPPFIKDVLDEARNQEIDLKDANISFLFAGEKISEKWRDYVSEKICKKDDLYCSTLIYGTADAGTMGHETPLTIQCRRDSHINERFCNKLFGRVLGNLPTFVQYDPQLRFTEVVDNMLIFTINTSLPLIRYQINDKGKTVSEEELERTAKETGIKISDKLKSFNNNPYIVLYGRDDVCTTFYALNIYPENIKEGLEKNELDISITGKFIAKTLYDEKQKQTLHIYVELSKQEILENKRLSEIIRESIVSSMLENNDEYRRLHQEMGKKAYPKIHLLKYGSPEFKINVKHKWTTKN